MEIILPPHKKVSMPVIDLSDNLRDDIKGMQKMLENNNFANGRGGYAIAHCQISHTPYSVFVAKDGVLPHSVIINPKIISKDEPYKTKEGCLSFPFRPFIEVRRYFRGKVRYQDYDMKEHEKELEGLQFQIFQHEIQHFSGGNIYK